MSVSAAASLLTFTDWGKLTSAQLERKLAGLGIEARPGKQRRMAQLNLWETSGALSPGPRSSAAEDRLVELHSMRAWEGRELARKYGLVSAAEAESTRLHQLVKLIFTYEFVVARPIKDAPKPAAGADVAAPARARARARATATATAAAAAAGSSEHNLRSASPSPEPHLVASRARALRDEARLMSNKITRTRDSLDEFDYKLTAIIGRLEQDFNITQAARAGQGGEAEEK
ncbi:hypothetical protein UCDDA912_g10782 [Diaporthe ampelina]|uniref:Uncharacterized protein n=1 Tax=Diaporthe ampelina TaxID=1214573 RepID=A0A0G2F4X5_9PEZI|nr:hypothetical protein UCDDA912_g10782 [Diaporthe ampelina]